MSQWDNSGYDDSWNVQYAGEPSGGNDINYAGEANDPFAYTQGSLLTPWGGRFDGSQYGGGGSGVADYTPFQYGDFNYNAANPGAFGETYNDPGDFSYGDYQGPAAFGGVTDKDMQADKGYQFRLQQGQKVLEASKAAQGILKTGGTAKALTKYGQDMGSQEYAQVYGRKRSEYDKAEEQGRYTYGTNRANTAENFDRNVRNRETGYGIRQGAWKDNAAVSLDASRHGFDVAQGTYDRNYQKARQGYDDEQSHAQAVASAGAAGSARDYNRALSEYQMGRDEFWTNQDRQYNILDREASRGWDAAYAYGATQADLATQRGNAQASGRAGSANAWNSALGTIGQDASGALYGEYDRRRQAQDPRSPSGGRAGIAARRPSSFGGMVAPNY